MSTVHLCSGPGILRRRYIYCRWCDRKTRQVDRFDGYWGGWLTCTGCGVIRDCERGEWSRPKVGIDRRPLIEMWNRALGPADYRKAVNEYMGWNP